MIRTRFAPSPTGPLHLGHAYSAILAHDFAKARGGEFLVRIEDLDQSRSRSEWEIKIFDDLKWLGLSWITPIMRQSQRTSSYEIAINKLSEKDLLYPCKCSRKDVRDAVTAPQTEFKIIEGPDGLIYPGTCKYQKYSNENVAENALRLDMSKASSRCITINNQNIKMNGSRENKNIIKTSQFIENIGDIVLSRKSMEVAYHLAVVVDDEAQGVSHVVRGLDLKPATNIHVLLQNLLGYSSPYYLHHKLIKDGTGKRLAKRDDAKSISKFREQGAKPADIRAMVGL